MAHASEEALETIIDQENSVEHVVDVDLDRWACSLARILDDVPQYMFRPGHPGRISKIPENLRNVNVKAYEPLYVSIGPYHHGKPKTQKMEKRKCVILKTFLKEKPELTLENYVQEIKAIELEARSFYSNIDMESDEFVQMLLLDSLYIFSVLCGTPRSIIYQEIDNEKENQIDEDIEEENNMNTHMNIARTDETERRGQNIPRWFWTFFAHDVFLIENQLPFFVLQKIHDLVYGNKTQLITTMKDGIGQLLSDYTTSEIEISQTEEVHHLLHLCLMFFHPALGRTSTSCQLHESSQMFRLGSAVQLYKAGVSFQVGSDSQQSLLDVTVSSSGKMAVPCLHVDDNTESLLRNLIALEQMKYPSLGLDVSAYAVLLLHLITTPEDVQLLRRKGIIQHHLASDKEMMYLINQLSVGLAFDYVEDEYSLKPVFQELKRYTEHKVPQWRAWLKHRYFKNPWTVTSLLAAAFLLILTVIQTYYSVYSYYYPRINSH